MGVSIWKLIVVPFETKELANFMLKHGRRYSWPKLISDSVGKVTHALTKPISDISCLSQLLLCFDTSTTKDKRHPFSTFYWISTKCCNHFVIMKSVKDLLSHIYKTQCTEDNLNQVTTYLLRKLIEAVNIS